MGADRGILLSARQFAGADTYATSYVLAGAIRAVHEKDPIDVIFFGKQAIDGDTAQVGPGVAVRLGWPLITYAVKIHEINLSERTITVERKTERWNEVIKAPLPAVVTCEKDVAELPFASLPDLVYSLTYDPEVWNAETPVLFDRAKIGMAGSPTIVAKAGTPEKPSAGEVINSRELGADAVVKTALEKILAAGVVNLTGETA